MSHLRDQMTISNLEARIRELEDSESRLLKELERQTQGWSRMWEEKCAALDRCEIALRDAGNATRPAGGWVMGVRMDAFTGRMIVRQNGELVATLLVANDGVSVVGTGDHVAVEWLDDRGEQRGWFVANAAWASSVEPQEGRDA